MKEKPRRPAPHHDIAMLHRRTHGDLRHIPYIFHYFNTLRQITLSLAERRIAPSGGIPGIERRRIRKPLRDPTETQDSFAGPSATKSLLEREPSSGVPILFVPYRIYAHMFPSVFVRDARSLYS
jgi:hypothetical protein